MTNCPVYIYEIIDGSVLEYKIDDFIRRYNYISTLKVNSLTSKIFAMNFVSTPC